MLVAAVVMAPACSAIALASDQCPKEGCLADHSIEALDCLEGGADTCALAEGHFSQVSHTFPQWYKESTLFDTVVLAGLDLGKDGQVIHTSEVLTEDFSKISSRQQVTTLILHEITTLPPKEQEEMFFKLFNSVEGRCLLVTANERPFCIGIDSQYTTNHQNALELIESRLLSSPGIQDAREMEAFIQTLHQTMTQGLPSSSGELILGGQYWNGLALVQREGVGGTLPEVIEVVRQKNPQAVDSFQDVYQKVNGALDPEQAYKELSTEEKEVFSLGFDASFPHSADIPQRMRDFCEEYVRKIQEGIHSAIELAAWVHGELVGIHPWVDGIGRVARGLVSGELIRGGFPPLLIFNEQKYHQAVRQGTFEAFLRRSIEQVEKLAQILTTETPLLRALIHI